MSSTQQLLLGEGAGGGPPVFIEDVFSTYLYVGNGSTQTITNNIDLSTKGGLVWIKDRTSSSLSAPHGLFDTVRGVRKSIYTNTTGVEQTAPVGTNDLYDFTTSGFSVGGSYYMSINNSATNYASWTFRKQPKFFDVVTYTGNATAGRQISHNLGSVPGSIFIKPLTIGYEWNVWHRSLTNGYTLNLNSTFDEQGPFVNLFGNDTSYVAPTSTNFTLGSDSEVNGSGETYIAYIFAHNAGGFGLAGTDNVISCGTYTGTGALNNQITLGYEPQFVIVKAKSISGENWWMLDSMRGMPVKNSEGAVGLRPNTSNAEAAPFGFFPTATGFVPADTGGAINQSGATYIYIAIRRGPMKVPTSGTSVFAPNTYAGGTVGRSFSFGFVPDVLLTMRRNITNFDVIQSRLIGINYLQTNSAAAEVAGTAGMPAWDAPTTTLSLTDVGTPSRWNISGSNYVNEGFVRAPSFMDVVCYTGTGSNTTFSHNLGVAPEWMMVKSRSNAGTVWTVWTTYMASLNAASGIYLNSDGERFTNASYFNSTAPTSAVFTVGTDSETNASASTYVNYLFATCAGVSKVGNFTGTAALQTIDCGFTSGARFVLIKRISSGGGNWFVWDSARGISSSDDPYLILNNDPPEVTNTNYVDTTSVGFQVTAAASTTVNASGGLYIFLAIA